VSAVTRKFFSDMVVIGFIDEMQECINLLSKLDSGQLDRIQRAVHELTVAIDAQRARGVGVKP
jgi:hypothetical protein